MSEAAQAALFKKLDKILEENRILSTAVAVDRDRLARLTAIVESQAKRLGTLEVVVQGIGPDEIKGFRRWVLKVGLLTIVAAAGLMIYLTTGAPTLSKYLMGGK